MLLLLALLAAVETSRITGTVVNEGSLPGVTVTLTNGTITREAITDADGRYAFKNLPPGRYSLEFELAGFQERSREVFVEDKDVDAGEQWLPIGEYQVITLSCGRACTDDPPENEWDLPVCADYELDERLIEALDRNDPSARDLLKKRFHTAATQREKQDIANALVEHLDDDRVYWKVLEEHAALAVRFPLVEDEVSEAFNAWCVEQGINANPQDVWYVALGALRHISDDARAKPLLLRALETNDPVLLNAALYGFASQKAIDALPAIEKALARAEDVSAPMLEPLAYFESPEADAVAAKFFDDDGDRELYEAIRAELEQEH